MKRLVRRPCTGRRYIDATRALARSGASCSWPKQHAPRRQPRPRSVINGPRKRLERRRSEMLGHAPYLTGHKRVAPIVLVHDRSLIRGSRIRASPVVRAQVACEWNPELTATALLRPPFLAVVRCVRSPVPQSTPSLLSVSDVFQVVSRFTHEFARVHSTNLTISETEWTLCRIWSASLPNPPPGSCPLSEVSTRAPISFAQQCIGLLPSPGPDLDDAPAALCLR